MFSGAGSGAKILVIDNDPAVLELASNVLVAEGHSVTPFADCEEALFLVSSLEPDLIIVDVQVPGFADFVVLKHLKGSVRTGAIPVMILTARKDPECVQTSMKLGAADYLTKPLDPARLVARVNKALNLGSAKQQPTQRAVLSWR